MKALKRFYTTGEVANFCGVTLRTVINWIKKGRIVAHQLPGTRGDNRIAYEDLIHFMMANAIPVPDELKALNGDITIDTSDENKKKVNLVALVVDDDVFMAKAIARVLRSGSFTVHVANNGFEAGRMFEKYQPNIMTLDLQMPKMDGFQVLEALAGRKHTKILVVSALGDVYMKKALEYSADAVLEKPFDNDMLLTRVNNLCSL